MNQDTDMNGSNSEQEVKARITEPLDQGSIPKPDLPLFLQDTSEGQKNDPQDEKDKSVE